MIIDLIPSEASAYTDGNLFDPSGVSARRHAVDVARKKDPQPQPKAPSGLTKADLIDVVYQRHGALTRTEAAEVVDKIFSTVKTSLGGGRPVRITNFGTFEVTPRAGRVGVDPSSGDRIFIPPHNGLSFRPARRLKSQVTSESNPRRRDESEG